MRGALSTHCVHVDLNLTHLYCAGRLSLTTQLRLNELAALPAPSNRICSLLANSEQPVSFGLVAAVVRATMYFT